MAKEKILWISHPEIGVCGLSCRLCPLYHTETKSRCGGCKTESRMTVGCSFITCAIKKKGVEFCWQCRENRVCEKWRKHMEFGRKHDSFKCYQKLEYDIYFIKKKGVSEFEKTQIVREYLLKEMLHDFNEGRSKSCYCIAATVLDVGELKGALLKAKNESGGMAVKEKSKVLHSILDEIAEQRGYLLRLRE